LQFTKWAGNDFDIYVISFDFPVERKGEMKTKHFVIPILVMALLTVIAAPPVQAELLTLSIVLAAVFTSAVVTTKVIKSETGNETASKPGATESNHQAENDDSKIALASQ
jgi:hypothetical protein